MEDNKEREFDIFNDTRKFEIQLFWQRALFFGGFISIIFIGFYSINDSNLKFVLSVLGLLCSFVWFLANKGSKFWQENWEGHIVYSAHGKLFNKYYWKKWNKDPKNKNKIFNADRFSPSKLAIALSLYIMLLWVILILNQYIDLTKISDYKTLFLIITIGYGAYVYCSCKRDTDWHKKEKVWDTNEPEPKSNK